MFQMFMAFALGLYCCVCWMIAFFAFAGERRHPLKNAIIIVTAPIWTPFAIFFAE